tara:strand:- start:244 stop:579 length:336 start_codon:yes stop_codon:yes gene_type:complete
VVEVEVINPKDRKRALKCCDCGMTYSIKDYQLLFDSEKLIYFKYKSPKDKRAKIYCHGCLLKAIRKDYPLDEIPLKIKDSEYEYICRYYTHDIDDDDDDNFLSGFDDIFKK